MISNTNNAGLPLRFSKFDHTVLLCLQLGFKVLRFNSEMWEPRGFGFVQFLEENSKKPTDMRTRERRGGSGRFNDRRRSPPRYSRSPPPRYSWSPPPRYAQSRSNSREYSPPPKRKQHVRSISPGEKRHSRERSYHYLSSLLEASPPSRSPL
ncbi:hypothetical protein Tco_0435179 [Tanacetum coccineum]